MRLPDWLVYLLVVVVVVFLLFRLDDPSYEAPPAAPPGYREDGPALPPASVFDPEVLIEVGPVTSSVGTAFAIDTEGWWLTARHIVADCDQVGIVVGQRQAAPVKKPWKVAPYADLALLKTERAPNALELVLDEQELRLDQVAFHIGYPQGRSGEAVSRLYGRETLRARGRYQLDEPVLAWAELGRTSGLGGSMAGMSGGPVIDEDGRVIGVTIAESARRGRIYTATPDSIARFLRDARLEPQGGRRAPPLSRDDYGLKADKLRASLAVAKVVCIAGGGAEPAPVPADE